jgi:hypothetical protein
LIDKQQLSIRDQSIDFSNPIPWCFWFLRAPNAAGDAPEVFIFPAEFRGRD